jgi:hypothetical protein
MISSDTTLQNSEETRTLFAQTMGPVAVTAGLFALGAYLGRDLSYGRGWVWFIAAFLCLTPSSVVCEKLSEGLECRDPLRFAEQ